MSQGLQRFISTYNKHLGPSRPNRFTVVIPPPDGMANILTRNEMEDLSFLCEASELPGRSFITGDSKIYGPITKMPYQTQYSDITMTFLCTNTFFEREFFEKWMDFIMPVKGQGTNTRNIRFKDTYQSQIRIVQFRDDQDTTSDEDIYAIILRDAFPISMAPQALNYSDDGFHKLTVQFAYSYYNTEYFTQTFQLPPIREIR